ncbi:MAG: O-antigen polymerase [Candidatus Aminicenantales bacterium]
MLTVFAGFAFCISVPLMRAATGLSLRRWTIPMVFWWTYVTMIFAPSFFVFANHVHPAKSHYFLSVMSVLLTVPLGVAAMNIMTNFRKNEIKEFWDKPVQGTTAGVSFALVYALILAAAIGLIILYIREVKSIPLFYMIRNPGSYPELLQLREESFKLLNSPFSHAYFVFRGLVFPFLVLFALGNFLISRQRKWLIFFLVSLGFGLFYAALSTAKMPVAAILLMSLLFYVFFKGRVKRKFYVTAVILLLVWPVVVILSLQFGQGVTTGRALLSIGQRLFYYPTEDIYYYFEYFPYQHDYLHGRSMGKIAWLTGQEYFDTPNTIGRYAHPEFVETINMNAGFIGDLNADFGIPGVLAGGILAGLIMQGIQIYLCRRRKTILTMVLFVFITYTFWLLHSMSLPVVLLSNGVVFVFILVWLVNLTSRFLSAAAKRLPPPQAS